MARLVFASLVTFGILIGMVAGCVLAAMVFLGEVDFGLAIVLTVIINLAIWLISPWLSDLTLRWFNSLEFLGDAAVRERYPGVHQLIHQVADEYRFKAPRIGFIPDRNPTAFTYGLLRSNARIVVTQGIFEFLSEEEQRAVVGHELGHIVNRDFILMTMAGMLVQILYQIYAVLARSSKSSSDKKGNAALVGLAALVAYYIGIYLLLYLSRTREYLADAFSARWVAPKELASALIKIAYGIVAVEDTEATQNLLRSTRHLGVVDVKNARYTGLLAQSAAERPGSAAEAMLFDCYNPWAALIQINSTHPLTGRRILRLAEIAKAKGQGFGSYDIEAAAERAHVSRGKLRGRFLFELMIFAVPVLLGVGAAMVGAWQLAPAAIAAGVLLTLAVRYPFGAPRATTVMALMSDPAASPVCGRSVSLEGKAIGRVAAGFVAGEDVVFQDQTGLMAVDFRSMLGAIGDLFAGWKRVPQHLDKPGKVTGWFKRSMGGYLVLTELATTAGVLRAKPLFWQVFLSCAVIAGNIVVLVLMG
ncbi:M48 family metalloprotease [Methyloceanibacter sp.]|uniref:M48 family metalloprotease n=1 Tax=Methyloceanibacter sp. TaxID=1965321 RepID=UPI002D5140E0|nr:M48 family metalloprotease [Methyloceanibacter sp.]HZP09083.1 M48 family metalloprotease [Methyloceanibacter sp.]